MIMLAQVKQTLRSFFELSVSEQRAYIILLPLLTAIVFSPMLWSAMSPGKQIPLEVFVLADSLLGVSDTIDGTVKPKQFRSEWSVKPEKVTARRVIQKDLNMADTIDFDAVPGIGWKTASRIVRYRDALGGFIDPNQLYEVFAIDSLAVFSMDDFFVAKNFVPSRINLNTALLEELEGHPYLSRIQARAILLYRFQHGTIRDSTELRKVRMLDEKTRKKLAPYVRFE